MGGLSAVYIWGFVVVVVWSWGFWLVCFMFVWVFKKWMEDQRWLLSLNILLKTTIMQSMPLSCHRKTKSLQRRFFAQRGIRIILISKPGKFLFFFLC